MNDFHLRIVAVVSFTLAIISATASGYLFLTDKPPVQTTYAVFDVETAIADVSKEQLRDTTNKSQAELIVKQSRQKVERWVVNQMGQYCPAPCVVFSKEEVVYGDVVNLNEKFLTEQKSY